MKNINIAIDGPSGAGKSTMAKMLAHKLGYVYVDTGAMYRTIGLYAQSHGVSLDNIDETIGLLCEITIDIKFEDGEQKILLCGDDVSGQIRTEEISQYASVVSALAPVRDFLLRTQRDIAASNNVVMDGRDIGTVILPNAQVKIFLTASAEIRAKRRFDELIARGESADLREVYDNLILRDKNDSSRAVAPLKPADDSVTVCSTDYTLEETLEMLFAIVKRKTDVI